MNFNSETDSTVLDFSYQKLEDEFVEFLSVDKLDRIIAENPRKLEKFNSALEVSLFNAFKNDEGCTHAHLFLQRLLYRINRLKLFWYDELENYANEDSTFIFLLRLKIENAWQDWEKNNFAQQNPGNLSEALRDRVTEDLQPEPSPDGLYIPSFCYFVAYEQSVRRRLRL
jgi:hypothetical protein